MSKSLLALALTTLLAALLVAVFVAAPAHADGTRVVCTQIPQKPGQLDEVFVANFMSEQLALGHARFETVTGVSTVLCAW